MKEERNKPQTFSADGCTGNQRSSQMWWANVQELSSPEPRTAKTSELNGSGGERRKGIWGPRTFVPFGGTNRDQRTPFCPGWWFQPGQIGRGDIGPGWSHQPGQKGGGFGLDWCLQPGPKAPVPLPFCPGPKGSRDKWPRSKACSVIV